MKPNEASKMSKMDTQTHAQWPQRKEIFPAMNYDVELRLRIITSSIYDQRKVAKQKET